MNKGWSRICLLFEKLGDIWGDLSCFVEWHLTVVSDIHMEIIIMPIQGNMIDTPIKSPKSCWHPIAKLDLVPLLSGFCPKWRFRFLQISHVQCPIKCMAHYQLGLLICFPNSTTSLYTTIPTPGVIFFTNFILMSTSVSSHFMICTTLFWHFFHSNKRVLLSDFDFALELTIYSILLVTNAIIDLCPALTSSTHIRQFGIS